jgi:hypothetical protein
MSKKGKLMALTKYDATKTYKNKIAPLVEQIKQICAVEKIPFFFTCATKNSEEGTTYESDGILTGSFEINLKEDNFPPILGVLNGGRVVFSPDDDTEDLENDLNDILKENEDDIAALDYEAGLAADEENDDDDSGLTIIGDV